MAKAQNKETRSVTAQTNSNGAAAQFGDGNKKTVEKRKSRKTAKSSPIAVAKKAGQATPAKKAKSQANRRLVFFRESKQFSAGSEGRTQESHMALKKRNAGFHGCGADSRSNNFAAFLGVVDIGLTKFHLLLDPAKDLGEIMAKRWYIVHTYSGYENKVKASLEELIKTEGPPGVLSTDILVPTEKVVELVKGQKKESSRKFYPGYVLDKHGDERTQRGTWSKTPRK